MQNMETLHVAKSAIQHITQEYIKSDEVRFIEELILYALEVFSSSTPVEQPQHHL